MSISSKRIARLALGGVFLAVLASSGYADGREKDGRRNFERKGHHHGHGVGGGNGKVKPLYDSAPPIDYVDCFWGEPFFYGGKLFYDAGYAGSLNANIDDVSATYWATRVRL